MPIERCPCERTGGNNHPDCGVKGVPCACCKCGIAHAESCTHPWHDSPPESRDNASEPCGVCGWPSVSPNVMQCFKHFFPKFDRGRTKTGEQIRSESREGGLPSAINEAVAALIEAADSEDSCDLAVADAEKALREAIQAALDEAFKRGAAEAIAELRDGAGREDGDAD